MTRHAAKAEIDFGPDGKNAAVRDHEFVINAVWERECQELTGTKFGKPHSELGGLRLFGQGADGAARFKTLRLTKTRL